MTSHDKVVERLAQRFKILLDNWCANCDVTMPTELMADELLNSLKFSPGDDLGNGLWAAPEELSDDAVERLFQERYRGAVGVDEERAKFTIRKDWQAMRRAAGGDDG